MNLVFTKYIIMAMKNNTKADHASKKLCKMYISGEWTN